MYSGWMRGRKRDKRGLSSINNSVNTPSIRLSQEEIASLEKAKELLLPIKEKFKLTFDDLKSLLEAELSFPVDIINDKLTVLESVVKYLKEEKNLTLHKISTLIKRNERNIWHTYDNAKKKYSQKFVIKKVRFWIPISIFSEKLSALESLVVYLKDEFSLRYHEIAILLKRDDRTIWTVYQRARKKYVEK